MQTENTSMSHKAPDKEGICAIDIKNKKHEIFDSPSRSLTLSWFRLSEAIVVVCLFI